MCLCQCCLKARARKDTEKIKIDLGVKEKAAHLHHIATVCFWLLCSSQQLKYKFMADLQRAKVIVRRRAMEDAYMALKFIRNIHDMMANKLYRM
ncbi:hypothetical protein B296_00021932 [Ensete ventricosum]|uniref:Uncharacterized protein n=1 Tax=Ensete ventricosum TaxID=4639 RepID=A0A426Z9C5_ENSVE|nr:hypothetical protein B296_00021932 [Ensete ventricosum]